MMKYTLMLLVGLSMVAVGCTPAKTTTTINTNTSNSDDSAMEDKDDATVEDDAMVGDKDDNVMATVSFNTYKNPATGYSINIPTTWYWRHYNRAQIGTANPDVNDYLFVSPTHSIISFLTEAPAEITVEVSDKKLSDFSDEGLDKSAVKVGGQDATRLSGVINNNVFSNYQHVEYRFSLNDKTYRIIYLANADLANNVTIFEDMVKSFSFNN